VYERAFERNKVKKLVHAYYDDACPNVTELSNEKYETYIVNSTTKEYINKKHFFVIAAIFK
jgi:hypothetical protein